MNASDFVLIVANDQDLYEQFRNMDEQEVEDYLAGMHNLVLRALEGSDGGNFSAFRYDIASAVPCSPHEVREAYALLRELYEEEEEEED